MDFHVLLHTIGVVRTAHADLATTPIQAGLNRAERGTIEIADRYRKVWPDWQTSTTPSC